VKFPGCEGKSGRSPDAMVSVAPRNGEETGGKTGRRVRKNFRARARPFFMKKFLTEKYFPLPIRRHIGRQGSFPFYGKFSAKAILGLLQVFNFPIVL
jgi:hypothetical protein